MVDVASEISKNSNLDIRMFSKIMTFIQKQNPRVEDDEIVDHGVGTSMVDVHDLTELAALADVDMQLAKDNTSPFHWGRRVPATVRSYELTHDDSNATGITFPNEMDESLKWGAGAKTDGSSYQIINDHSWFDATELVIAMGLKLPASSSMPDTDGIITGKGAHFQIHVEKHTTATNRISVNVWTGAVLKTVTFTYTPDTWFSLIMHADSSNLTVWKDNVQQGQVATGGALDTNTNNVGIWATATGTSKLNSGCMMAFLTFADKDIVTDSAWRTAYHTDAILDYEDGTTEEITTFPYIAEVRAEPNSHSGFFWG